MERKIDSEMQDLMEDISEDLKPYQEQRRGHRRKTLSDSIFRPGTLFFGVLGLFFLGVVFVLFAVGDNDQISREDLILIDGRIQQLEKRMNKIEGATEKDKHRDKQMKKIQRSLSNLDHSVKSLRDRENKLSNKIDNLRKRWASMAAKGVGRTSIHQTKERYHEVKSGDTLYRIASRYGLTVPELRRLNNLTKNQAIYPGQRLLVSKKNR